MNGLLYFPPTPPLGLDPGVDEGGTGLPDELDNGGDELDVVVPPDGTTELDFLVLPGGTHYIPLLISCGTQEWSIKDTGTNGTGLVAIFWVVVVTIP